MSNGRFWVSGLLLLMTMVIFTSPSLAAWGSKELDTEKIAVNFYREAERGGYKVCFHH